MPKIVAIPNSGSRPSVTQLALGDLAINTFDGKAYIKQQAGSTLNIVEIGTGDAGTAVSASYADFALSASYAQTSTSASFADTSTTASFALNFNPAASASYAVSSLSASYAESASYTDFAGSSISASYAATASSADTFIIRTALTASGLNYPTVDGLENQVLETDGNGNLVFDDIHTMLEDIFSGESITKGDPLYISGSQGALPIVYKADAANPAKMPVAYIAAETVGSSTGTRGIILGLIEGINLTGYPAGTEVYVAAGGGWTSTRPTGSATIQVLGYVTKEGSGGKGLVLNPGPANLPNLLSGSIWIGNNNSIPTVTPTASLSVGTATSASYAATASYAPLYLPLTGGTISGDLTIQGTASVNYLITTYESSSIIYSSGSTKFGDTLDDTHVFTGSLFVTGSQHQIIGPTTINDLTGSLFGTASWAENAISASSAIVSNLVYVNNESTTNTNFPLIFKGDSLGLDDYRPLAADTGGPYYNPASNTLGSTGTLVVSASSFYGDFTGSLLGTASYALNAEIFPYTGSAIISGSLTTIGDFTVNNATSIGLNAATINLTATTLRAPFLPLATPPGGTTLNTVVIDALSGTLYVTGSLPNDGGLSSYIQTGSIEAAVDVGPAAAKAEFFRVTSGSVNMLTVNANRVTTLETRYDTPPATTGSIFYSASGDFFFGTL